MLCSVLYSRCRLSELLQLELFTVKSLCQLLQLFFCLLGLALFGLAPTKALSFTGKWDWAAPIGHDTRTRGRVCSVYLLLQNVSGFFSRFDFVADFLAGLLLLFYVRADCFHGISHHLHKSFRSCSRVRGEAAGRSSTPSLQHLLFQQQVRMVIIGFDLDSI